LIPAEANCFTISNPIPLFAPVTTAYLKKRYKDKKRHNKIKYMFSICYRKYSKDKEERKKVCYYLSLSSPIFSWNLATILHLGNLKIYLLLLGIAQLHTTSNLTWQHNISFSIVDNLTPYLNMHAKFKIET
jgi:hypothetical protein